MLQVLFFLVGCSLLLSAAQSNNLLVQTQYGPVLGHTTDTNKRWLGIPFAAPPVGDLRWQPPQTPASWTETLNASTFSKACPQTNAQTPPPPPWDEDCLYLNVYAPLNTAPTSKLPVYIWMYGGAWTVGYTQKYEGSFLAGQDIIVVSMNYRMGLFGFLASPLFLPHSPLNTTGMYGLQDQRAAIQWVKDNIAAFGGDPNHVTVGGQSAGAGLSCIHLVAPRSAGLFTQMTMESAFCSNVYTQARGYQVSQNLFVQAGCNKTTDADTLACMLALPQATLLNYTSGMNPTMDAYEGILDTPYNLLRQGVPINAQRIIMGNTLNETGANTCPANINMTAAQYNATIQRSYPSTWQQVYATYPLSDYPTPVSAYIAVQSDTSYNICQNKAVMDILSTNYTKYVWAYSFQQYPTNNGLTTPESCAGAAHGFDLYYLFPSYAKAWSAVLDSNELVFAQQFRDAWAHFVMNGVPTLPSGTWPMYTFQQGSFAVLKAGNIHVESHLKVNQCPLWGYPSPVPTASVALVPRPYAFWSSNGLNYQIFDVKVSNTGSVPITALEVQITLGDQAFISQSWNLNQVSPNIYALPSWYQGFAVGGTSDQAGFVLTSPGILSPSVAVYSITY